MSSTESTPPTDGLEPVCAPGVDPVELCTVKELGIINRQLGCDAVGAGQDPANPLRWEAMARVGWILDRRRNQTQSVDVWLDLPLSRMLELLGLGDDDRDEAAATAARVDEFDAADPTVPAPGQ